MQQARRNGTPAYKRIQSTILKRIEHGHLKPGDAVGSERELARVHKVSLMTARHALAGLERDGIVERRPGAGTFVAPPKIHFNKLMSYTEQMSSRGLIPCSDILCLKLIEGDPEIAARLGLNASAPLVKLERVRHTATEPFALETCYLPAEQFSGLTSASLGTASLFSTLERDYSMALAYADEQVDATAADERLSELLGVAQGAPLLRIRQVIYSSTAHPTIYVLGLYRPERHTLFIRRYR